MTFGEKKNKYQNKFKIYCLAKIHIFIENGKIYGDS